MTDTDPPGRSTVAPPATGENRGAETGRVAALVGLSLLEVIRTLDLPTEVLASEDPAQTMPRRLGLSVVVDQQIRLYREQVRRRVRITDRQAHDLFHLVLRRPDSEEAFLRAGELLADRDRPLGGLRRFYPERLRLSMGRREVRRRLRKLMGRAMGGYAHGPFTLEARAHFLLDMDPGGDACALVTGLAQAVLSRYLRREVAVVHSSCEARKQDLCRWVMSEPD